MADQLSSPSASSPPPTTSDEPSTAASTAASTTASAATATPVAAAPATTRPSSAPPMMGPLHPKNQKIRDAHPYQSDLGVETAISGVPSGDSNAMAAVQHKNQPQDHQDLAMSTSSSDDPIATPTSSTEFDSTANLGSSVSGMKAGVGDAPSDSHAMAASDEHDHLGIAHQEYEGVGVQDLGWQPETDHIHNPLIAKMPNEDLWMLIRRFNQQMYDVKATTKAAPGGLDLVVADEEAFSPDKLTANLERFYVEIGLGMMGFAKQIVRLRSWREKRRTIGFAGGYFIAWALNLLMPSIFIFLIVLIVYPPSRNYLFPPVPQSMVDSRTGAIKKPKAGLLGSKDTLTGAQERHKGEAAEQEAHNFITGLGAIAFSSATGEQSADIQPGEDGDGGSAATSEAVPNPAAFAMSTADASQAHGSKRHLRKHDKTKQPMETMMWTKVRPVMHGLSEVTDTWERVGNCLNPVPPFHANRPRMRIASLLVPAVAMSLMLTPAMFTRGTYALVGFIFFSDPLQKRGIALLNQYYPQWPELLELRRTIFKGTPTNAQLTITLLRIGEANKKPLPPPPHSMEEPSDQHIQISAADIPMDGVDQHQVQAAIESDEPEVPPGSQASSPQPHAHSSRVLNKLDPRVDSKALGSNSPSPSATSMPPKKKGGKLLGLLRGGVKYSIEAALGADRFKAAVTSSEKSRDRLGVISDTKGVPRDSGPVSFKCRYQGKKGFLMIDNMVQGTPRVYWSKDELIGDRGEGLGGRGVGEKKEWELRVDQIVELKKVGGLDWKAKAVVAWATEREVADGLEIGGVGGMKFRITAVQLREELFNRLVAMGPQKWEAW